MDKELTVDVGNQISGKVIVDELAGWVREAARRLTDLVADLDDDQLIGPRLAIINPGKLCAMPRPR
jgi:hypothetical protein